MTIKSSLLDDPQTWCGKNIISAKDLTKAEILALLDYTDEIRNAPLCYPLKGMVMASCFFEPSTRTRLSFEVAMKRLGGDVIGFSDSKSTSISKRETVFDTIKIIGGYADIIVIRHPLEGAARYASEATSVPIINAGDGSNQHPTQTLLDLYTIRACQGRLDGIDIAFVGDLKHSRTIHSLVQAACLFNMRMHFVAPPLLELPKQICDDMKRSGVLFSFHKTLEEIMPKLDIIYATRIQEERLSDPQTFLSIDQYAIRLPMLALAKPSMKILHPLPRVSEIDHQIDHTEHAHYFEQAQNGIAIRQALLTLILGKKDS